MCKMQFSIVFVENNCFLTLASLYFWTVRKNIILRTVKKKIFYGKCLEPTPDLKTFITFMSNEKCVDFNTLHIIIVHGLENESAKNMRSEAI